VQHADQNTGLLTAIAMTAASLMIAQHIAGKATRDALFLSHFEISDLPKAMMISAAVSVVAVLAMSRLLARHGPARLIPPLYLASAALLAGQWVLTDIMPTAAAAALYLHVAALNSILISGFWSVINERFDPYAAKRVIARLTAAATFGGLLGGLAAKGMATIADTNAILLMLSGMHLVCGLGVGYLARGAPQDPGQTRQQPPGNLLAPLKRSRLIRGMAILGLLVATTAAVLDYLLKAEAAATLSKEELITFFSYFYTAVGLGSFLVQSAMGNKALRWFGLGGSMAAWPLIILVTGTGALLFRSLVTVTLMRASANLFYNSFFRAGFELLYTPISPADKRSGKVLIDVGADRSGDLLGGLIIMALLAVPVAAESLLFGAGLVLAAICLVLVLVLHRAYVRQLADNLRSGQLRADEIEIVDATTAHTVASTQTALDRDQLLAEIARFRDANNHAGREPDARPAAGAAPPQAILDATTEAIMGLRSGEATRIRRVLTSYPLNAELLPHAIRLLSDEAVLRETLRALRKTASSDAGQLVDALLDPMQHPLVRRRLPLVLARSDSPLAIVGLTAGLDSPDWNTRFRCAQALQTIRSAHPGTRIDETLLLSHAEKQARIIAGGPHAQPVGDPRLQFVFYLFGAVYDPETLDLCWRAMQSGDRAARGTALEYLENRVPMEIWLLLQPILAPGHVKPKDRRSLNRIAQDLFAHAKSLGPTRQGGDDATAEIVD
jgi:hypothetical protein